MLCKNKPSSTRILYIIFNITIMKTIDLTKSIESGYGKSGLILRACKALLCFILVTKVSTSFTQDVLFDFDNAPLYTSLPITQVAGGITAHLAATGQGYSIQNANVLGFTPPGFAGHILYPNSIYLSDIRIRFDQIISDFSIMYSCQELGCDDAATMRMTAYLYGTFVGTNTKVAANPGTWPVDTLRGTFPQGFDSVVVHYASPPPTCQDYGTIYMADNMRVTQIIGISRSWTGSISNDWNTPGNWSPTGVPNLLDDILIPSIATHMPVVKNTGLRCHNIFISKNATLTINPGKNLIVYGSTTSEAP